jgi:prepilin-type processing-associated H-X9-DG protein
VTNGRVARAQPSTPDRAGLTIIEALVSLTIVGLLLALLVPAVLRAREAARLAACRSNLRQIGIGTHAYLDTFARFPGGHGSSAACLFALLPFVEHSTVFAEGEGIRAPAVKSASIPVIPVYICPNDPTTRRSDVTSYLPNKGLLKAVGRVRGFVFESVSPAEVTDGFSQTAYMSEFVTNDWHPVYSLPQSPFPLLRSRAEIRTLCDECAAGFGTAVLLAIGGDSMSVLATVAGYNHLLPPNSPGCDFLPLPIDAKPPVSGHSSGANVLFADGSVRFVSGSIDRDAWWGLGTIDSGEVITE